MTTVDTTRTTAQFNEYYPSKQAELSGYTDAYNKDLSKTNLDIQLVSKKISEDNANIKSTEDQIAVKKREIPTLESERVALESERAALKSNRATLENERNGLQRRSTNWLTRYIYRAQIAIKESQISNIDGRLRIIDARIKNIDDEIQPKQKDLGDLNTTITQQTKTLNIDNESKSALDANKDVTNTKIAQNNAEGVTLMTQKEFYDNREKACKDAKELIERQKTQLATYETELAELNKEYETCNLDYEAKCSTAERDKLTQLTSDRGTEVNTLDTNGTDHKKAGCKDNMPDCSPFYSVFQEKRAKYDDETKKRNVLHDKYNTSIDPTKNECKDFYNAANVNKSKTNTNVDMLNSSEGFTQYSTNYNADITHARLVANYKSVQNDYTKLKQNIKELNNANNNDVGKTSRYATKKQLYDNTIYTNILLTALATSMIYYVFVDI